MIERNAKRIGSAVASVLMLATVGCGDGPSVDDPTDTKPGGGADSAAFTPPVMSAEAEATLRLRAEVDFPDRGFVKFFEPEDGVILIQEGGRNNMEPLIPSSMSKLPATELYEALSGQKAPGELVQAATRAAALLPRVARTEAIKLADLDPDALRTGTKTLNVDGTATISSALTFSNSYDQWFYDNFCAGGVRVGNGWDYVIQWMFVTGSGSFTRTDMNWVDSTVSVYGGDAIHYRVRIQPWYSWSTVADVMVQNGYYNKYHRDNGIDFDFNVAVDQAAGDSYHWCSYGSSY